MSDDLNPTNPWKRRILTSLFLLFTLPILGLAVWTWGALKYSYAIGERAGYLQKISKKGWLCKTWEGEIAMVNLPGAMPEKFNFSVRDEAVAQQLVHATGQRISLTYEQHRGVPTSCFGETPYFAVKVTPLSGAARAALSSDR